MLPVVAMRNATAHAALAAPRRELRKVDMNGQCAVIARSNLWTKDRRPIDEETGKESKTAAVISTVAKWDYRIKVDPWRLFGQSVGGRTERDLFCSRRDCTVVNGGVGLIYWPSSRHAWPISDSNQSINQSSASAAWCVPSLQACAAVRRSPSPQPRRRARASSSAAVMEMLWSPRPASSQSAALVSEALRVRWSSPRKQTEDGQSLRSTASACSAA